MRAARTRPSLNGRDTDSLDYFLEWINRHDHLGHTVCETVRPKRYGSD